MAKDQNTQETATEEAAQVQEQQALENFEWDTTGEGDFFGVEDTAVKVDEVEEVVAEVKKDTNPEDTIKAEVKTEVEEEEKEDDFFGVKTKETPEGTKVVEVEEKEKEDIADGDYKSLTTKMKEKGIFQNIEIPEEEEITEDKFIELQDLEVETRVEEAFEGFFSELDADAAAFLKFKKEGGETSDFFKTYKDPSVRPTGDIDDEAYQEKLAKYYYQNIDNEDSEDVDDKVEWLKTSGKLDKVAQKLDQKLTAFDKKAKEDLLKAQADSAKSAEEGKKAFVSSVQKTLESTDKVDNFIFTEKSKKTLLPFITKQTVKVGKNKYITPMQSRLSTALRDPEKMLVLAQLLENDFDVDSIVANAQTVNTKKLKNDLQRKKTGVKPASSGKVKKRRSLTDFF